MRGGACGRVRFSLPGRLQWHATACRRLRLQHYLAMQVAGGADRVVRGDWGAKADAEAGLSGLYLVSLLVPAAPLKKMCALKDKGGVSGEALCGRPLLVGPLEPDIV